MKKKSFDVSRRFGNFTSKSEFDGLFDINNMVNDNRCERRKNRVW